MEPLPADLTEVNAVPGAWHENCLPVNSQTRCAHPVN